MLFMPKDPNLTIIIPEYQQPSNVVEDEPVEYNCSECLSNVCGCFCGLIVLGLTSGAIYFLVWFSSIKWVMFKN